MIARQIVTAMKIIGNSFPVMAMTGPRQIGKTTLAKQFAEKSGKEYLYLDMESPRDYELLLSAPQFFLEQQKNKLIIIDEIQRMKTLFPLIRHLVDKKRTPLRFILLGSASPDMIRDSSETLAGRIVYLELGGITINEAGKNKINSLWFRGGFPTPFLTTNDEVRRIWFENFLFTYVQRDLPALGAPASPVVMQRLIRMLAHVNGQLLNISALSRSIGLSVNTLKSYLDYLENGYLIRRIQPWHANFGKRLVKTPKIYLRDVGLFHHLMNIYSEKDLRNHPSVGASFESFAVENISQAVGKRAEIFFYKEHVGGEVDLLITQGNKIKAAIEIKLSSEKGISTEGKKSMELLRAERKYIVTADNTSTSSLSKTLIICSLANFIENELPQLLR